MGGSWLARRNVGDFDNIEDWMAQRNADVALRPDAEAAGREAWDQATRSGQGLSAAQPSDVVAIGAGALNQGAAATVAPDLRSAEPVGIDDPVQVGRLPSPDAAQPDLASPGYGLATARPGDSISWLLGTSSPAAIGRFASLNGMDGRDSTLYAGHGYAVPTRFGDASPDEIATGNRMLRGDNARLAALRPQLASDPETTGRFATLINAGINPWTGAYSAHDPNIDNASRPPAATARGSPPAPTTWLDRSGTAKALAGEAALGVGQVAGLVRGGRGCRGCLPERLG